MLFEMRQNYIRHVGPFAIQTGPVCSCICIHTHICVYVRVHAYNNMYYIALSHPNKTCMFVYTYLFTYIYIYRYMYVYIYICIYSCIYIYIYVYIYIHICILVNAYTSYLVECQEKIEETLWFAKQIWNTFSLEMKTGTRAAGHNPCKNRLFFWNIMAIIRVFTGRLSSLRYQISFLKEPCKIGLCGTNRLFS